MDNLDEAVRIAEKDTRGNKIKNRCWNFEYMPEVNEPVMCIEFLRKLNDAIEFVSDLSDTGYYLDHIWNASSNVDEMLKSQGLTEEYFNDVWSKLEKLRAILFGDALDFHNLYRKMYGEVVYHETYWKAFYEGIYREKETEIRRLKRKLEQEGIKDE